MMESNSFSSQVQFLLALILLHALTWITGGRKQGFNAKPGWGSGTEVFFLKLGGGGPAKGTHPKGSQWEVPTFGGSDLGTKDRRFAPNIREPPPPARPTTTQGSQKLKNGQKRNSGQFVCTTIWEYQRKNLSTKAPKRRSKSVWGGGQSGLPLAGRAQLNLWTLS